LNKKKSPLVYGGEQEDRIGRGIFIFQVFKLLVKHPLDHDKNPVKSHILGGKIRGNLPLFSLYFPYKNRDLYNFSEC
jgi:hypothetical protein